MFATMNKMTKEIVPKEEPKPRKKTQKEIFELPKKYTKGLTKAQAKEKTENVKKTQELLKKGKKKEAQELAKKRPTTKEKKESSNTIRFKKEFPNVKPLTQKFANATGIPLSIQKEIVNRGRGAFVSAGSRASVSSPTQWGIARLYSFFYKSRAGKLNFDKDLLKKVKIKK